MWILLATVTGLCFYTWKSCITPRRKTRAYNKVSSAVQQGDVKTVKSLVQSWKFNSEEHLKYACRSGQSEVCLYLCGGDRNKLNVCLKLGSMYGKRNLVEKLLESGADSVNEALQVGCEYGQVDVLEPLIKAGASAIKGMKVTTNSAVLNKLSVLRSEYSISLLNDSMKVEGVMNM